MATYALITGASGGIGLELAKVFAANGHNLILVARSQEKLERLADALRQQHAVECLVMPADLTREQALHELYVHLKAQGREVDVLVNNAGIGKTGAFHESEWEGQEAMLSLNINALTLLTHLFVKDMESRGSGKILNIASTAAFQPGPLMAVYYASKAYVLSFSEALHEELEDKGVTVTTVCPGPTVSDFHTVSGTDKTPIGGGRKMPESREVAAFAYDALKKNKRLAIPGTINALQARSIGLLPRSLVLKVAKKLNSPLKK